MIYLYRIWAPGKTFPPIWQLQRHSTNPDIVGTRPRQSHRYTGFASEMHQSLSASDSTANGGIVCTALGRDKPP